MITSYRCAWRGCRAAVVDIELVQPEPDEFGQWWHKSPPGWAWLEVTVSEHESMVQHGGCLCPVHVAELVHLKLKPPDEMRREYAQR